MMHVTGYEHYVKDSAIQMFTQRVVEITDQQCPRLSNYSLIDSANGSYGSPDTSNTNVQDYQSIVATILQIEATGRLTPAYLHGYYQRGLTLEPICFILIMQILTNVLVQKLRFKCNHENLLNVLVPKT